MRRPGNAGPRFRAGVVLRPVVGRGTTGPLSDVGSLSEGASCEGSGAGRDVKVRPGAPSAGTSRRFFVQEPLRAPKASGVLPLREGTHAV